MKQIAIPEICSHQDPSPQKIDGKKGPPEEALWYQCSLQFPMIFQLSLSGPQFLSPTPGTQFNNLNSTILLPQNTPNPTYIYKKNRLRINNLEHVLVLLFVFFSVQSYCELSLFPSL